MSEKKQTDVKNDVETRLTRLEALMRIVKRHIADVDERVGAMPHHEEMSKIDKAGFANIKMLMGAAVMFALVTVACWVTADTVVVPSDHVAVFGYPEVGYVDSSGNLVVGGAVSSTGAISNSTGKVYCSNLVVKTGGTVSLPTGSVASAALPSTISNSAVISNVNMKVYGSNLVIVTGGTVDLPSASIASTALPAIIANSTVFSNVNAKVYGSNLVLVAGGTIDVPADAVSIDALNGITVTASQINAAGGGTTATLTPTLVSNVNAKVYGSNLQVVAGGTVTLPAASVGIAALSGGVATNYTFTFVSSMAKTGRMWFANGVLTNVVHSGE